MQYIYMYIYIYICACVYVYIYIYTHTHTQTHTYIHENGLVDGDTDIQNRVQYPVNGRSEYFSTLRRGEFRPRQTRQLPRAVDLKGRLLSCQSY